MSSKLEQVLEINPPNELVFKGRYDEPVTSTLTLTNPSDKRVMYKIKTTAPKMYCVRPPSGMINAKDTRHITISFQPSEDAIETTTHKFMVQSAYAPPGDVNMEQIWKNIIPAHLMDTKLKCVFNLKEEKNEERQDFTPKLVSTPISASSEINDVAQELLQDIKKEQESFLKLENQTLRDQIRQLQMEMRASNSTTDYNHNNYSYKVVYFVVSLVVAITGAVFGKYVL
ncbi:vesicle-associated membrane protein-associated protein A-like [Diabrotica virgifera virgifera]|uniref:MSP domain-containing protein n=1 Tax=Diabrotica virgifera virgifera TaxID=50390 RepID=A0ABM5KDD0_DIAVI|nr:vesicle-associated membrane protein-associated protein A-like [Diabrotica virgifera virgifera]